MSLEINPQDVIKLCLQYCKENGLTKSFRTLQDESGVTLNTVDSVEAFHSDIVHGRWDVVLKTVQNLKLPPSKLMDLFEQIVLELMEVAEFEMAHAIVKETMSQNGLRKDFPERCMRLEHMSLRGSFDAKEAYPDMSKEKRRHFIADDILTEISVVPSGRLLSLLGQLLKYQAKEGVIQSYKYDLFTGKAPQIEDDEELHPKKLDRTLKYGADARIEVAKFSPNGNYLVTGSVDGIIEVLEPSTGKLKTDLAFQAEEKFMIHSDSVVSLNFTKDGEMLASGSKNGQVKVWRIMNGNCLRKYDGAHGESVTSLLFGKDPAHVISAGKEIKVWGLKSGKKLKEFPGHSLTVTDLMQTSDGNKLISGSRDGMIKVWDYKSTECLLVFKPPNEKPGQDCDVFQILPFPYADREGTPENYISVSKNYMMHLMNTNGQVVRSYKSDKKNLVFEAACLSAHGSYLYGLTDQGQVCCFETETGKLAHEFNVAGRYILGISHHPLRNIITLNTMDGELLFYKS